jgi:hypothetical protein
VFYTVELKADTLTWEVSKRYSELRDMHIYLQGVIGFLPDFPGKTLMQVTDSKGIEKR